MGQQQRGHQIGAWRREGHQKAQGITPDVRDGIAEPRAAQRTVAIAAVACKVGDQWQPGYRHGNDQIKGGQRTHAAVPGAPPQRREALGLGFGKKLPAKPQQ